MYTLAFLGTGDDDTFLFTLLWQSALFMICIILSVSLLARFISKIRPTLHPFIQISFAVLGTVGIVCLFGIITQCIGL